MSVAVQDIVIIAFAFVGVGIAIYNINKLNNEIQDRGDNLGSNSFGSFSFPIEHTPTADARDADIPEASYAPSLFRGSVDEPTASEIPHAISSRGGKTKRKRMNRKRSRRKK